jgi:Ca2+-binding RTX toxin-like protein
MIINGTAGNDSLTGTTSDDTINGLEGNDTINALAGDDRLDGGAGTDSLNGGLGNDTYIVTAGDVLADSGGVDTVVSDVSWTLGAGFENLTMTGTAGISVTGNELGNFAVGNSGANYFNLRAGNDTIQAGAGNDSIDMSNFGTASYGDDVVDGGAGFDTVSFTTGSGQRSGVVADLAAGTASGGGEGGIGSATLTSVERVIGAEFADRLSGSSAAERFEGRAGNDTLSGLGGNDTLIGGTEQDTFVFASAPGSGNVDLVTDFLSATDKLSFDNSVFTAIGGAGNFSAGDARFAAGAGFTSGRDSSDRIVYNTTNGNLYYDADGSSAGASQLVATLQGTPTLVATDINVIGQAAPPPPPPGTIQGTAGDDSLTGTEGNDSINGLGGNDTIDGRGGNDTLDGGLGGDTLWYQSAGSAVVVDMRTGTATGGSVAGSGTDMFSGFETVIGTDFHDRMTAHDGVVNEFGVFLGAQLYGTQGNDTLIGGAAGDFLSGDGSAVYGEGFGNGNDEIRAGGGDDFIDLNFLLAAGTYGNDTIDGGAGTDDIHFYGMSPVSAMSVNLSTGVMSGGGVNGAGSATLISIEDVGLGNTDDTIIGNDVANFLHGGDGYDTIRGGGGDDVIRTGVDHKYELPRRAELYGDNGDDVVGRGFALSGVPGALMMSGGAGNDTLQGTFEVSADNFLFAEAPGAANADEVVGFDTGRDKIELHSAAHANLGAGGNFAAGDARFAAGAGFTSGRDASDRVVYNTTTGELFYDADGSGAGATQLIATLTDFRGPSVPALAATDIVATGQGQPNPGQGTAGNDSLTGTAGDDLLQGLAGNDTLSGLAGNDTLDAGTGGDLLIGGAGNDIYIVDGPGDTVTENAGEGTDTVQSSATRTLDANVENLTLTGTAAINGTGNSLNNVITGNSANNVLNAGTGGDTLIGGAGNDTYIVDGPGDTVTENAGQGTDTVQSSATRTLDANVENLTLTGSAAINGTGNALNNVITGNSAANSLAGGAGNDTYFVAAGDTVIENAGQGTDTVRSSATRTLDANVENLTLTGSAAINGTGNALSNVITGNNAANSLAGGDGNDTLRGLGGNDTLSGGGGNDRLEGRTGNDSLTGGSGVDHFVFLDAPTAGGVDRITDFVRGTDELLFENAVFSGLGASGAMAAGDGRFRSVTGTTTTGQDSTDRLVYNSSTGSLYYDADGSGSGGSVLVATFAGNPALAATDFTVI